MRELQLNLYEAFLPGEVELLIRERPDTLLHGESEFGHKDPNLSVLVAEGTAPSGSFIESFQTYDLHPPLVQRLIVEGLANSFKRLVVERELLTFNIFDPKDKVIVSADFIDLLRGVSFRAEHVTFQGKSYYGFFVSMKVRRHFNETADRKLLLESAIGEQVRVVQDGRVQRVKLLEVKGAKAKTETDSFEVIQVPSSEIQVSAGQSILARYAQAIGQPELASTLIVESQVASFRYTSAGTKARHWLKSEMNFVGSWLARLGQNGRLPFKLPNSPTECYVGIRPAVVKEKSS
ncbi:MAG: hypothetical protein JNM34_08575 [Chthonomonadaceae bacterium]|nr:hypothetical protein [Chthonomonadaceae bacterium]